MTSSPKSNRAGTGNYLRHRLANTLRQSYDWCYRVSRGSGSSFYRAFWLLGRPQRIAMFALYAFARITDDLGDGPVSTPVGGTPAGQPIPWKLDGSIAVKDRLQAWSQLTTDQLSESAPRAAAPLHTGDRVHLETEFKQFDLLWPALRDTVMRYGIPPSLLQELVAGVAMDAGPVRMADWAAVDHYAYHVASSIGLACTRIWQAADTLPKGPAIDCGLAFQMTNILRDIREDAANNRIYLPLSELEKYGCDETSWLAGQPRGDWPGLVASAIQRTRSLFESGKHTMDHLPKSGKRIFGLMWTTYHELLNTIAARQAQVWSGQRVRLSTRTRAALLLRALIATPDSGTLGRG